MDGRVAGLAGLRPAMTLSLRLPGVACHQREGEQGRESGRLDGWSRMSRYGR